MANWFVHCKTTNFEQSFFYYEKSHLQVYVPRQKMLQID